MKAHSGSKVEGEWSGVRSPVSIEYEPGWTNSQSGYFGEEKILSPLTEFKPPFIQLVPSHYTDYYAIMAPHASNRMNINMSYLLNTE
jgi:hypothetical protein